MVKKCMTALGVFVLSCTACAEIFLSNQKTYKVPDNEQWLILSYKHGSCIKSCPADLVVKYGTFKIDHSGPAVSFLYSRKNQIRLMLPEVLKHEFVFNPGATFLIGNNLMKLEVKKKILNIPKYGITGPARN